MNGVGDEDFAAILVEEPAQTFGDHRLAVPWRAVNKDRLAAADGGAQLVENARANNELTECIEERFGRAHRPRDRLLQALADVVFQWDRSRADIPALVERLTGAGPSEIGEVEPVRDAADEVPRADLDTLFVFQKDDAFVDDVERQP